MANELQGLKIAFLAADGVEQIELTEPWKAVERAGGTPELISLEAGEVQGVNHMDKGDMFPVDKVVADADPDDYAGIVQPGGVANPDFLRADPDAVRFFRAFFDAREAGRRDLPRPVDARGGRRGQGPEGDQLAERADRPRQRGGELGRRGMRGRRRPGDQPEARRPPGVLRRDRRGVRGRRAGGPAQGLVAAGISSGERHPNGEANPGAGRGPERLPPHSRPARVERIERPAAG